MNGFGDGDGAGFMNQGFSPSSQSQSSGSRAARIEHITPTTAYQIKTATKATEENFAIDGREVGQIVFVGIVRELNVKSTKFTYKIEDHTGVVEVNQWVNADDATAVERQQAECRENIYVRVFGNIRGTDDMRRITAFNVTPLADMNEITHHNLYVLQTHLIVTQGHKGKVEMGLSAAGTLGNPHSAMNSTGMTTGVGLSATTNATYGQVDNSSMMDGQMTPEQSAVLKVIRSDRSEAGPERHSIISTLNTKMSEAAIERALEFLCNEGHIYSTIDDDHFKSTDDD